MNDAPKGWKLVPVEPTEEMAEAASSTATPSNWLGDYGARSAYRQMLAAAPSAAPSEQTPDSGTSRPLPSSPSESEQARNAAVGRLVREKLVSLNSIPVWHCTIRADEVAAIDEALRASPSPSGSTESTPCVPKPLSEEG